MFEGLIASSTMEAILWSLGIEAVLGQPELMLAEISIVAGIVAARAIRHHNEVKREREEEEKKHDQEEAKQSVEEAMQRIEEQKQRYEQQIEQQIEEQKQRREQQQKENKDRFGQKADQEQVQKPNQDDEEEPEADDNIDWEDVLQNRIIEVARERRMRMASQENLNIPVDDAEHQQQQGELQRLRDEIWRYRQQNRGHGGDPDNPGGDNPGGDNPGGNNPDEQDIPPPNNRNRSPYEDLLDIFDWLINKEEDKEKQDQDDKTPDQDDKTPDQDNKTPDQNDKTPDWDEHINKNFHIVQRELEAQLASLQNLNLTSDQMYLELVKINKKLETIKLDPTTIFSGDIVVF